MSLDVEVNLPVPDRDETRQEIHEAMTEFLLDTLAVWVTETTQPIPVLTGASRASFLKLAAEAKTAIQINPKKKSRISLGVEQSTGVVVADARAGIYGWDWTSRLEYIHIVDSRVNFIEAGERAIEGRVPTLPEPVFEE